MQSAGRLQERLLCVGGSLAATRRPGGLGRASPPAARLDKTQRKGQSHPDLMQRHFPPQDGLGPLWVAGLTQYLIGEGWLYRAIVLDAYSRRVIEWAMDAGAQAELVVDALNMPVRSRLYQAGCARWISRFHGNRRGRLG